MRPGGTISPNQPKNINSEALVIRKAIRIQEMSAIEQCNFWAMEGRDMSTRPASRVPIKAPMHRVSITQRLCCDESLGELLAAGETTRTLTHTE